MGLIFFTYFFAVSLLANSLYLTFRQSNRINTLLSKIALSAAVVSLCIAVSVHLVFHEQFGIQRIVSMLAFFFMVLASYHILDMALAISELKTYKIFCFFSVLIFYHNFRFQ